MVTTALGATMLPLLGAAGALGCASLWAARWPTVSFIFLGLTVVLGQTVRFPLPGQGGGLLLSDVATVLVLMSALAQFYGRRQGLKIPSSSYRLSAISADPPYWRATYQLLLLFCPFIVWSIGSLVISSVPLDGLDFWVAGAYWVRLTTHLLLIPALLLLCRTARQQTYLARTLVATIATLAALGLIQLLVLPRLQVLPGGWDPHIYRLVATWLDPNLMGGFFAITLPWLVAELIALRTTAPGSHPVLRDPKLRQAQLGLSLSKAKHRVLKRRVGWSVFVLMTVITSALALLLTQSRSSLMALAVGVTVVSPLVVWLTARRTPRYGICLVGMGSSVVLLVVIGAWLLGDRAWGLLTFDPTVTVRLRSLAAAWPLVYDYGVVGVGYNAYQFAAQQAGLISDFTVHSRAGADNSWLTLLVTTGVIGMALFVLPWLWIIHHQLFQVFRYRDYQALAGFTGVIIWLVHSQFVNSLFYSHLLITMAMLIAVTWPHTHHD